MQTTLTYREMKETPVAETRQPAMEDIRDMACNITMDFIKAGKATFTVANGQGSHYTFQVTKKDPEAGSKYEKYGPTWFVALLTGPDNTSDYTYMGMLVAPYTPIKDQNDRPYHSLKLTQASKFTEETIPVRTFNFAMRVLEGKQELPAGYSIRHNDLCARCGRQLTDPTSLLTGLGPICRGAED